MGTDIIVDDGGNPNNVNLTLTGPFQLNIGFSQIDLSSSYLVVEDQGKTLSVIVKAPSFLLGLGNLLNVGIPLITLSVPEFTVTVGSNFSEQNALLALLTSISTPLDVNHKLNLSSTDDLYLTFRKMVSENWNSNNVSDAHRKFWSNNILPNIATNSRKLISMLYNRYSTKTSPTPNKRTTNQNYIIKL